MSETYLVNNQNIKQPHKHRIYAALIILFSIVFRWIFILLEKVPFNSDEAIVGIMASHILEGGTPTFFYGQAYMGSLDGYLIAGAFQMFGTSISAIRISQSVLFLILSVIIYEYAKLILNSHKGALITVLFIAAAPVNFLLYTTVTLGGYLEALIIGIALLLVGNLIEKELPNPVRRVRFMALNITLGALIGFGLWVLGITLIFSISALVMVTISTIKQRIKPKLIVIQISTILVGLLLGALPVLSHMIRNGGLVFIQELSGSAIAVTGQPYFSQLWMHTINLLVFGITAILGFRPPWNVSWLLLPLIPVIAFCWLYIIRNGCKRGTPELTLRIWLPVLILIPAFIATPFGADPSGRYFLPFQISLSLAAGLWFIREQNRRLWLRWGIIMLLAIYNIGGAIQAIVESQYGMSTQFAPGTEVDHIYDEELIGFLKETNNLYGYSTYWTAYPVIFKSKETVILVPALPYHADLRHTTRDDRYKPYSEMVKNSENPVYITSNNLNLDKQLVAELTTLGVTWKKKSIGDFQIYFDLSRKVLPEEIGFGVNRP